MSDEYLLSLFREYLALISLMRSGEYAGDNYRVLSALRTHVHNELIRLTGHERPFDMERYARSLVPPD
jgi:hypothetical protein